MSLFCSIKLASDVRRTSSPKGRGHQAAKSEATMPKIAFYSPMFSMAGATKIDTSMGPSMMDSLRSSMPSRFPADDSARYNLT